MVEWNGTVVLTTPRLVLRTFRRDDLPLYAALNADPEVARYLGGPLSRRDSDDIAEWAQECYAREGLGLLAVERRRDGAFLGMCGLHHQQSYPDDVEVAWRLAYEHWGRGYATEAATGWLDHGFGTLGLPRVIAITDPPNLPGGDAPPRDGVRPPGRGRGQRGGLRRGGVLHHGPTVAHPHLTARRSVSCAVCRSGGWR